VWKENFNFTLQDFVYKINFLGSIKYLDTEVPLFLKYVLKYYLLEWRNNLKV